MSAWIPLIQTVLWISLIVWLVSRYNTQVVAILNSILGRIDKGSSIKAGPFEIGSDIQPQNIDDQKQRLKKEVEEQDSTSPKHKAVTPGKPGPPSLRKFRQRYLMVEDLALRELQAEFGALVNRQIRLAGVALDGMFAKGGTGYAIEIKYVPHKLSIEVAFSSVMRLHTSFKDAGLKNVTVILALVGESNDTISSSELDQLRSRLANYGESVIVRTFGLEQLATKFGIELDDA